MDIDSSFIGAIINNNILSLEYEVQQCFEHEILVEASAAQTQKQRNALQSLFNNARAYLQADGNTVSLTLNFLSVPPGLEDYAEMLISNSRAVLHPYLRNMIGNILTLDEAQEEIRHQIREWAIAELRTGMTGGVLR